MPAMGVVVHAESLVVPHVPGEGRGSQKQAIHPVTQNDPRRDKGGSGSGKEGIVGGRFWG